MRSLALPGLPLSWGLPLAALIVSSLFVFSALPGMFQVRQSRPDKAANIDRLPIDPAIIAAMVQRTEKDRHRRLPDPLDVSAFLNMPAMLVEILLSLPTTWPDSWYPMLPFPFGDLSFWRAISWPIFALPLWSLAGRSLDALRQSSNISPPHITLFEVLLMGVVGVLSAVCGIGISLTRDQDGLHEGLRWLWLPGLLWLSLGILPAMARRRQKRNVRGATANDQPA